MSELEDYINFLREVSAVFRPAGILLSVALHQQQYLPADVFELIDRVRIMTYDMPGEPRDNYAAMEKLQNAVQGFIDNHCPPQKIVVGIPAYARHSKNPQMVKTYAEIFDEMKPTSEDMLEKQPWNGYSYDSPNEVRRKVEYAVEKGLAGVFFWELGQDKQDATFGPGGILLGAASSRMLELTAESAKAPSPVKDDGLSNEL
jgi:GH18 family chitinase